MGQAARDLRREDVENARERLADDMQSLAYQVNLPRRMRDKVEAQVVSARRRIRPDRDASVGDEAMWDIGQGRRASGLRKLGSAALMPAAIGLAVGAAAVVAARRRDHAGHVSHGNGTSNKGAIVSAVVRSGVTAAAHSRHARKTGRAPGLKHFAAYAAVGAATSAATKWLNDRIDRTAPMS